MALDQGKPWDFRLFQFLAAASGQQVQHYEKVTVMSNPCCITPKFRVVTGLKRVLDSLNSGCDANFLQKIFKFLGNLTPHNHPETAEAQ